jgi:hypothetical protein
MRPGNYESQQLNVSFSAADIFAVSNIPDWRFQWDLWPQDILLRRKMDRGTWSALYTSILSNEIAVFDKDGPVPKEKIEDFFKQGKDKLVFHAAKNIHPWQ